MYQILLCIILSITVYLTDNGESFAATTTAGNSASQQSPQCGHHVVMHCCRLLGVAADMQSVMKKLPPRSTGHSMLELIETLKNFGLRADGRIENYAAMSNGKFPAIAHVRDNHFVALERANNEFVTLLDGNGRRKMMNANEFKGQWDGKLLLVTREATDQPWPECERGDSPRIQFDSLFIDKGEIAYHQDTVEYMFQFRNIGKAALNVERVRTSCACLKSQKPSTPILPGKADRIVLSYRASLSPESVT